MTERITSGQKNQIMALTTAAMRKVLDEADIGKKGAQRVIMDGGEFGSIVSGAAREALTRLSISQDFAGEEDPEFLDHSNRVPTRIDTGYITGYRTPVPIADQITILRRHFGRISLASCDQSVARAEMPCGAEGWFAIPRWQILGDTYGEALDRVLAAIGKSRGLHFSNYRPGSLCSIVLREGTRKVSAFEAIADAQAGKDILVLAAQFGARHRGRSVRRARVVMDDTREFGLGVFEVAIMLLTHPNRLAQTHDLWIHAPGDEYSTNIGRSYKRVLYFYFQRGGMWCASDPDDGLKLGCGSVSGFLLQ